MADPLEVYKAAMAQFDSLAAVELVNQQQAIIDSTVAANEQAKQDSLDALPKVVDKKPSRRLPLQIQDLLVFSPDIMEAKNVELGEELDAMEQSIQEDKANMQSYVNRREEIYDSLSHLQKIYNETEAEYATKPGISVLGADIPYWKTVFNIYDTDNPEDQAIISLTNQMNELRTELGDIERFVTSQQSLKEGGAFRSYSYEDEYGDDVKFTSGEYASALSEYEKREKLIKGQRKTQILDEIDKLSPTDTTGVDSLLNTLFPTDDE
jgi:hypothetical protein